MSTSFQHLWLRDIKSKTKMTMFVENTKLISRSGIKRDKKRISQSQHEECSRRRLKLKKKRKKKKFKRLKNKIGTVLRMVDKVRREDYKGTK